MTTQNVIESPYSTTPTATTISQWDGNSNLSANSHLEGYTTTATAAGTTTLTVGSTYFQFFTGSTTQTCKMPVTSTLALGQSWLIVNNSTGIVTVESSGGNTIQAMAASTALLVTCILLTGTTASSWNITAYQNTAGSYLPLSGGTLTGNLAFNPTTDGITGTTAADNAGSGTVGEFISSNIAAASAISVSSNTPKNLTSLSLTAGDWDVGGNAVVVSAGVSMTETFVGINTTSATQPDLSYVSQYLTTVTNMENMGLTAPQQRINISSMTTVYIVVTAVFSTSTATMYGNIWARRRR
jgi:hypothetical protein